jgi:AcrR family transcriptional regulator
MPDKQLRNRDRKSTEGLIIAAFEAVLLRDGLAGLGINAVAEQAGVNKVLIYRYFGDLVGLARRWVNSANFWPTELELIGNDPDAFAALAIKDRIRTVMGNFVDAIRSRPTAIELMTSELLTPSDISRALADGLIGPGTGLTRYTGIDSKDREFVDQVWKLTQFVYAIVAYFTIRTRNNPAYIGMDLSTDEAWVYIRATVDEMVVHFLPD